MYIFKEFILSHKFESDHNKFYNSALKHPSSLSTGRIKKYSSAETLQKFANKIIWGGLIYKTV